MIPAALVQISEVQNYTHAMHPPPGTRKYLEQVQKTETRRSSHWSWLSGRPRHTSCSVKGDGGWLVRPGPFLFVGLFLKFERGHAAACTLGWLWVGGVTEAALLGRHSFRVSSSLVVSPHLFFETLGC